MNPNYSKIGLIAYIVTAISLTAFRPDWLGDSNKFLSEFINHNYINVLGVLLAITVASLSQIHLSLTKIEERRNKIIFNEARLEIVSAVKFLIIGFISGFVLVILKPLIVFGEAGASLVNSAALFILLFYLFILADITFAVFDIGADIEDDSSAEIPDKFDD